MNAMTNVRLLAPPMPLISEISVVGDLTVQLKWTAGIRSGRTEKVDLSPLVGSFKFYKALRKNPKLFGTVHIADNGNAIAWGDGTIDMSATSIERLAEEAMTADDFRSFLKNNKLTHDQAASILGRSRRQIENYLAGGTVPRIVALACYGYEARKLRPKPQTQQFILHTNVQIADTPQLKSGAPTIAEAKPVRVITKSAFREATAVADTPKAAAVG